MVPKDDFYRKINQTIDFRFLQKSTKHYYGTEGQKSIDPIVFFKICMVGYLNNLNSDRALIRFCANALKERVLFTTKTSINTSANAEIKPFYLTKTHELHIVTVTPATRSEAAKVLVKPASS
jgi:transposase